MKTRNRRYPWSSGMDGDKSGESGAFLFSQCVPDSAMVCDHSRQIKTQICTERGRRRWISLITNLLNCWAPVLLSQINMPSLENLGQTSDDYPIYLQNLVYGRQKIKILDRPGFSRHMKTRLKGAKFRRTDLRKVKGHIVDHLRSLGNWLPTPPPSDNFALREN